MIAFAPFMDEVQPPRIVQRAPPPKHVCTECNMLVLAFKAGIFLMAIFDALK